MMTRHPDPPASDLSLFELVYSYLAQDHGATRPRERTRHICHHVTGNVGLIGFLAPADLAVYRDPVMQTVYVLPHSDRGVHVSGARIWACQIPDLSPWLTRHGHRLDWLNPQYRPDHRQCDCVQSDTKHAPDWASHCAEI